jgi:hypothetical protein
LHSGQVPRYGVPFALSSPQGISKGNGTPLGTNGIYEIASSNNIVVFLLFFVLTALSPAAHASGLEASGIGVRSNGLGNCWIGEGTEAAALFWQPAGTVFGKSQFTLQVEMKYTSVWYGSDYGPKNTMPFFPSGQDWPYTVNRLEPDRLPRPWDRRDVYVPALAFIWRSEPAATRDYFKTFSLAIGAISSTGGGGGLSEKFDFQRGGRTFTIDATYMTSIFSIGVPILAAAEVYKGFSLGFGPVLNWGMVMSSNFKNMTSEYHDENYNIVNQQPFSATSFGLGWIVGAMYNWQEKVKVGAVFKAPYYSSSSARIRAYRQGPVTSVTVDSQGNLHRSTGQPGSGSNPIDDFNQQTKSVFKDFDPDSIGQDYGRAVYYDVSENANTNLYMPPRFGIGISGRPIPQLKLYADWYMSMWSMTSQTIRFDKEIPGILMNMDIVAENDFKDTQEFAVGAEYRINKYVEVRTGVRFTPTYLRKNGVKRAFFPDYKGVIPDTTVNGISIFNANPLTTWMVSGGATVNITGKDRLDLFLHGTIPIAQEGVDPGMGTVSSYSVSAGLGYMREF